MDGGIDLFSKLLERIGRAGRGKRRRNRAARRGGSESRGGTEEGTDVLSGHPSLEIFLQLSIGVDINRTSSGSDRDRGIFPEVEARDGDRFLGLPMAGAEITLLMLFELGAGGDQAQLARPPQEKVIRRKFRVIPKVGVPAFPGADKEHTVAGVLDHVAAVVKMKRELLFLRRRLRKHDIQIVVAVRAALLKGHAFILEKGQRLTLLAGDAVNAQRPGKLESEDALGARFCAQEHRGSGVHRVVGGDCSFDGIVQPAKSDGKNGRVRQAMRGPDIVERFAARFVELAKDEWLVPLGVEHHVESAGGCALKPGIETGLRMGRQPVKKNAKGIAGI